MLDNGLSTTEWSGNCCYTTLCDREECIDNSLSCDERHNRRNLLCIRTTLTNRPFLHQCQFLITLCCLNYTYSFFYCEISALDLFYSSFYTIWNHDLLSYDNCLLYGSDHISGLYLVPCLNAWNKWPFDVSL